MAAFEAIIAKPLHQATTTGTPDSSAQASLELSAYLQSEGHSMPKKLIRLFNYHIDHPNAQHIQLKLCSLHDSDWKHFHVLATTCKYIKQLVVWKVGLSSLGFRTVCKAVNVLQQLEELTLEDVGLGHHRLAELAKELRELKCLRAINLAVNDLGAEEMEIIAPALGQIGTLEIVNLDENLAGDGGCQQLCKALEQLKALTSLSFRHNCLSLIGLQQLVALGLRHKRLKVLAEGNDIGERELEKLCVTPPL
jgi:hypothetical protein